MNRNRLIATLTTATLLLAGATLARAETMDDMRFGDLMSAKMIDHDKDGMVSRAEFIDMMGKMWDARVRKMGVKNGKMTMTEFDEILKYMKAGA
jgi:hypothetical protein